MPKSVLIDSCIWFDLLEAKEETVKFYDTLNRESAVFIVPYPSLYEVLNTRLVKRRHKLFVFETVLASPQIRIFDDVPYRDQARREVFDKARWGFDYSFVDCVFREILNDRDNRIDYLATINVKDFLDVCTLRNTEIIHP